MSKTRRLLQLTLALALATSVPTQAASRGAAGDGPPPSIAAVEMTASRLDWSPVLGLGSDPIVLTIAGPQGFFFEKRFPHGTPPAFELREVRDRALPDGAYSFELRTLGKGVGLVQSGFFSVREGSLFVPATAPSDPEDRPKPTGKPGGGSLQTKEVFDEELIAPSACFGEACGEGDGGAPLRLKSTDALAINFDDVAGGFTAEHSWRIQANDIFVGAGEYFKIVDAEAVTDPFTIAGGAPDNSLFVSSSGNLGLGTATPSVKLDAKVTSSSNAVARLQNLSSSGYSGIEYLDHAGNVALFLGIDNANGTTRFNSVNNTPIVIFTNSTERIRFPAPGGNFITAANGASLSAGGTWTNASSRTYKHDIVDLNGREALEAIQKLEPVKFRYNSELGEEHVGFIAEDVPDLVAEQDRKGLSPMDVVAVLTKVVQEQQKTIETLKAQVEALQREP